MFSTSAHLTFKPLLYTLIIINYTLIASNYLHPIQLLPDICHLVYRFKKKV